MKLGYNTWSTPMLSLEENVELFSRVGYDSIELTVCEGWPTDAMLAPAGAGAAWRKLIDDAGLHLSSITGNVPVLVPDEEWSTPRERLLRSFDIAAEAQHEGQGLPISLGALHPTAPGASFFGNELTSEEQYQQDRSMIIDRFAELSEEAGKRGVRVALECHVAAIVTTPERALDVLGAVNSEHMGLNLDISHFDVQGMDIPEVVSQLAPHALVCEVKDQIGVHPDFQFLVPGEGNFDYVSFLRELNAVGYNGAVSVEVSVLRQRGDQPYDPIASCESAYRVLSAACEEAGVVRG